MSTQAVGTTRITFVCPVADRNLYERLAADMGINLSEWIRQALDDKASGQLLREAKAAGAERTQEEPAEATA